MAHIVPFKAIRPAKDKAHLVASRTVDSYSHEDLNEKLATNPYAFLHIIHPDFNDTIKTKPGSPERLKKIKSKFLQFVKDGIFVKEKQECFYVYRQTKNKTSFTGIIGCSSIDDYFNGVIKVHEQTLTEREEKLKNYLEVCDFNAEPVCTSYPDDVSINNLVAEITSRATHYEFTTTDKVTHGLWVVDKKKEIETISNAFKKIPAIYIADGHHRSASSALLGKSRREKNKKHTGKEPYNFFLCIYFPESQLKIYDFNRVVKDLHGLSSKEFLKIISEKFDVEDNWSQIYQPNKLHNFSMYLEGHWYSLTAKKGTFDDKNPVNSLDAALLSENILVPILKIKDLKTDKRIAFVSGIKGLEELKKLVDSEIFKVAFALYPATMKQIKSIADTGSTMPPKSTWVEPKMRSGLTIYSLSE